MSDAEARLLALLAQDRPAERDAAFRLAVLERLMRRRLWARLAALTAGGLAVTVAVWTALPDLAAEVGGAMTPGMAPALAVLIGIGAAAWGLSYLRRPV